jgi:uncharacterized protein YceK
MIILIKAKWLVILLLMAIIAALAGCSSVVKKNQLEKP